MSFKEVFECSHGSEMSGYVNLYTNQDCSRRQFGRDQRRAVQIFTSRLECLQLVPAALCSHCVHGAGSSVMVPIAYLHIPERLPKDQEECLSFFI